MNAMLWLLFGFGIPGALAYILTFKTNAVVRMYARSYRGWYKNFLNLNKEEINKVPFSTFTGLPIGSIANFVERGVEHPEEFPKLISYFSSLGQVIWAILGILAALIIFAAMFGRLRIV